MAASDWRRHPETNRAHRFDQDRRALCGAPTDARMRVWGKVTRTTSLCRVCQGLAE